MGNLAASEDRSPVRADLGERAGHRKSPATVAEVHRLASAVLRSAVRNRLIAFNPCEGIRLPKRRRQDTADQVVSQDEVRSKLLPVVPERYQAIVATAAGTGLRWGEVAGLQLDVLDLDGGQLRLDDGKRCLRTLSFGRTVPIVRRGLYAATVTVIAWGATFSSGMGSPESCRSSR